MAYKNKVVNDIGISHPRKNQYLLDLSNGKKIDKSSHPYIKKLEEFKNKEKSFLSNLKKELEGKYDTKDKIKKIEKEIYEAKKKLAFYENHIDLTYDAELEYRVSAIKLRHLPDIIENDHNLKNELKEKKQKLSSITEKDVEEAKETIAKMKADRKRILDMNIKRLKEKNKSGFISDKALKNEIKREKLSYKENVDAYEYINKKKSYEEDIKNIKHRIKLDYKTKQNVLKSDISDIRRKLPIEVEKKTPIIAFLTMLFPGLGQLLLKQYIKAFLFFIGTLFTYLVAVPYSLGYGNYQGTGISGLISLASEGKRLDKSIIFLIEGVIAIMLLIIAFFIIYISFRDVYKTEKNEILGIRKNKWFETKQSIEKNGFPYIVNSPALIVTMFIVLVPIVTAILISFTNLDPNHQSKFTWIGFENYQKLFLGEGLVGQSFWLILGWTLIWTFGSTTLAIALGFTLALIANQDRIKGKTFFRTIYLLPWAVPAFITIMFFSLMLAKNGPITEFINKLFGVSLDVKNNTIQTRITLMLLQGWLGSSYVFLLSTGVLQGIPSDLYEAAEIDGATGFKKTWRITIPLVLFQTAPLLIGQYTFNFNNFSIIYLFNGGGPFNPSLYGNLAGSSDLLISYIYKLTMQNNYQAVGAAVSIVISFVLMFFAWLGFKNTAAFKED